MPKQKTQSFGGFRVVTYNVKDFDDPVANNNADRRKFKELTNTIDELDSGFIGFQEVRSEQALRRLNSELASPFPWFQLIPGNSTRQHHFAFLSRYPVTITSHAEAELVECNGDPLTTKFAMTDSGDGDPNAVERQTAIRGVRFQRDLVLADVNTPSGRIAVFMAHLKSMRKDLDRDFPDNPGQDRIRQAEANTIRLIVQRYERDNPTRPVIILGDLNATNEMKSVEPLLRNSGFVDIIQQDWIDNGNHPSYSYRNPPAKARLDYLLLSPHALRLYATGSACIHRVRGWKTASDHLPVSATFHLEKLHQP